MKKLKHSKYKNTGFLFELLVRQITADIINSTKKPIAERLLKKYFSPKTELGKELKLYSMLLKEKYNSEAKSISFIDAVLASHTKLSVKNLREQKYNLIKEIKMNYPIDDFLRASISEYRVLASIYKLFENNQGEGDFDPSDASRCKETLVEHVMANRTVSENGVKAKSKKILEEYQKQEKDLQLLSYKMLVDKFNKKYGATLCSRQKKLLKEYINNISNTNSLVEYVNKEIPWIFSQLKSMTGGIDDTITKIKLTEVYSQLNKIKRRKLIKEEHITALLLSYELIQEISRVTKGKNTGCN